LIRPVSLALELYTYVLIMYVVFSWVPRPPDALRPFVIGVARLVEPLAAPLRRSIPPLRLGMVALDLSIIVLFIGIRILRSIAASLGI
jgi:YggT family protein